MNPTLIEIAQNDPTVHKMIVVNATYESIAIALAREKQALIKRIIELETIAPRKFRVAGVEMVWQCPVALIPESQIVR